MRRRSLFMMLSAVLLTRAARLTGTPARLLSSQVRLVGWPWYGKNGGFYLAKARGYFERTHIGFAIRDAYQAPLAVLTAGEAEVAQVSTAEALRAIERGASVEIIAVRDAVLPVVFVALPASGVRTPRDCAGKRWGVSDANWMEKALLQMLAARTGFDGRSVRLIHVDTEVQLTTLMERKIDFIAAWWGSSLPQMLLAEHKFGVDLTVMRWSQYGVDTYGDCLVARTGWLQEQPQMASAFLSAAIRGFKDAIADPAAAVAAITKLYPDLVQFRDVIRMQATQAADLLYDSYSRVHGLFSIDRAKLARTRDASLGPGARAPLERAYTNAYLPGP
jgi:NitT/TauT family transport system substrate-binding protein